MPLNRLKGGRPTLEAERLEAMHRPLYTFEIQASRVGDLRYRVYSSDNVPTQRINRASRQLTGTKILPMIWAYIKPSQVQGVPAATKTVLCRTCC